MAMNSGRDDFDEDDLCYDIFEIQDADMCLEGKTSLIVWGNSWDPYGWEASEEFLKKWHILLSGCSEIWQATNYWRSRRGEKALAYEVN